MNEKEIFGEFQMFLQSRNIENLVELDIESDISVVNPFLSTCGRYNVNPIECYGEIPYKKWLQESEKRFNEIFSSENINYLLDDIKESYKEKNSACLQSSLELLSDLINYTDDLFNEKCENYPFKLSFDELTYDLECSTVLEVVTNNLTSDINEWFLAK